MNIGGYDSYEQGCTVLTERLAYIDTFVDNVSRFTEPPFNQASLKNELMFLQQGSRRIGHRWNMCTPVHRLPYDVLAYIFRIYINDSFDCSRFCVGNTRKLATSEIYWVIPLTHVCRVWRCSALSQASLWTTVNFGPGLEWGREMLARSRRAPVDLSMLKYRPCDREDPLRMPNMDDMAALVPEHMHHIRRLFVSGCLCDISAAVVSCFPPAPVMEVLEICMIAHGDWRKDEEDDEDDEDDEDRDSPPVMLDSRFLSEKAPKLRSMSLEGCCLPWTSPFLRNLTNLKISLKEHHTSPALGSTPDLIRSLQAMPALQSLKLSHCFPPDLASHSTSAVISLPLLADLEVSGTVPECKALFQMLDTPSLFLSCSTTNQNPAECCTVLPTVSAYLLRADNSGAALRSFALVHDHDEASLEVVIMIWELHYYEPKFKLCFSWPASPITPDLPTLEKVCDVFAPYLSSLEAVRVWSPAWRPDH